MTDFSPMPHARPHPLAGRLAAPSFVLPGTVAENTAFLRHQVDEVGLCFFEAQACLNYGPHDLPPAGHNDLRFHVHLPVDLPWPARGLQAHAAADLALAVCAKAGHLQPRLAVLHPPAAPLARQRRLLAAFAARWQSRSTLPLLLENIDCCTIADLGETFLQDFGLGLCLDVGHLMGYVQANLLSSPLPERAALVHWSAPGRKDRHLPLTAFSGEERHLAQDIMSRLPATATHLVEIFHWQGLAASLPILADLADGAGRAQGIDGASTLRREQV